MWLRQHAGDEEDPNLQTPEKHYTQVKTRVRDGADLENEPQLYFDQLRYFVLSLGLAPAGELAGLKARLDKLKSDKPDADEEALAIGEGYAMSFERAQSPATLAARADRWGTRGMGALPLTSEKDEIQRAAAKGQLRTEIKLDLTTDDGSVFVDLYEVTLSPTVDDTGVTPRKDVVSPDTKPSAIITWGSRHQ